MLFLGWPNPGSMSKVVPDKSNLFSEIGPEWEQCDWEKFCLPHQQIDGMWDKLVTAEPGQLQAHAIIG